MKLQSLNQEITCVLLLFLMFVSAISVGYSQSPLPEGYPKLIDTGNPVEDHRKYDAAKQAWIAANPDAYRKMTGEGNTSVLSQKSNSENKRTETLAESNPVMIPPYNPEALMLQNNSTEEDLNVSAISKFKDFPVYKDTGNPEEDAALYNQLESEWNLAHPEEYKKVLGDKEIKPIDHKTTRENKVTISRSEFNQLSLEKQIYIKENPNFYNIVDWDVPVLKTKQVITAGELFLMDENLQQSILSRPEEIEIEKTKMRKQEFDKLPSDKQTWILSYPNLFEIVN